MNSKLIIIAMSMFAVSLHADPAPKKSPTKIDFNKMIDDSDTASLSQEVSAKTADKDPGQNVKVNEDKKKVLDFVDVEIGLGEGRPVVDRRFNSVKPAVVAQEFTVKLVKQGTP